MHQIEEEQRGNCRAASNHLKERAPHTVAHNPEAFFDYRPKTLKGRRFLQIHCAPARVA